MADGNESVGELRRLERVKEWFKKICLGASALVVTVAGLLTTILIGARTAVAGGGGTASSFAKSQGATLSKHLASGQYRSPDASTGLRKICGRRPGYRSLHILLLSQIKPQGL